MKRIEKTLQAATAVLLTCAGLSSSPDGLAQAADAFPARPIRLLAPFAVGGTGDTLARLLGQRITDAWQQQIVVENRAGAGGVIGMTAAKSMPADGYHYVVMSNSAAASEAIYSKLAYDVRKDFDPVVMLGSAPMLIAVNPAMKVEQVADLVRALRSEGARRSYGSCGVGSAFHLAMELFKYEAKMDITHVPYKGCAPAVTDAISGQVDVVIGPPPALVPHVRTGKLRAMAVTFERRASALPEVPTVAQGVPGMRNFSVDNWYALLAPKGAPKDVTAKMEGKITELLGDADVRAKLSAVGIDVRTGGPGEVAKAYADDVQAFTLITKAADIRPQ
jgi:tripartite-type tricarboxylate transporter receptor subunit TctC